MTRRLILMRHAKSSWTDPMLRDHDRPLNRRGRQSAAALGNWLRAKSFVPDHALSSSSVRTQETFERLRLPCPVDILPALYHAAPAVLMDTLRAARGQSVLMIAHNPGIADFASRLVTKPPVHDRFFDFPTCATLVAEFKCADWADIEYGQVVPIEFVIPRALKGD